MQFFSQIRFCVFICVVFSCSSAILAQQSYEKILEGELTAHGANRSLSNTPLASFNGNIYLAYVNPELKTIVAMKRDGRWFTSVVSEETRNDDWHNQPSIAVDREGYVHVVYNMHSTPWQYKVSRKPEDISAWEFRGQDAGEQVGRAVPGNDVRDTWMSAGTAAIPGNQITYPYFASDRSGELYLAYRECFHCTKSDYFSREWSGGIANYDAETKTWRRVGQGAQTFAHDKDYVPLGMQISFDAENRMHVSWVWNLHYRSNGSHKTEPNFPASAWSDDGGETFFTASGKRLNLPIDLAQSDVAAQPSWLAGNSNGYFFPYSRNAAMPDGSPFVLLLPHYPPPANRGIAFVSFSKENNAWSSPQLTPGEGTRILIDTDGTISMLTKKVSVWRSKDRGKTWKEFAIDLENGSKMRVQDMSYFVQTNQLRLQTMAYDQVTDRAKLRIWTVNFSDVPLPPNGDNEDDEPEQKPADKSPPKAPKNIRAIWK